MKKKVIMLAKRLEKAALQESNERNPLRNPTTDIYVLLKRLIV